MEVLVADSFALFAALFFFVIFPLWCAACVWLISKAWHRGKK